MSHVKRFRTYSEYEQYRTSGNMMMPNTSHCLENNKIYYNDNGTIDKPDIPIPPVSDGYKIELWLSNDGEETYNIGNCTLYTAYTFNTVDELLDFNEQPTEYYGIGSWGWKSISNPDIAEFYGWFDEFNPSEFEDEKSYWGIYDFNSIRQELIQDSEDFPEGTTDGMINAVKNYLDINKVLKCFIQEVPSEPGNYTLDFDRASVSDIILEFPSEIRTVTFYGSRIMFKFGTIVINVDAETGLPYYTFVEGVEPRNDTFAYLYYYNGNSFIHATSYFYENGKHKSTDEGDLPEDVIACIEDYLSQHKVIHIHVEDMTS